MLMHTYRYDQEKSWHDGARSEIDTEQEKDEEEEEDERRTNQASSWK